MIGGAGEEIDEGGALAAALDATPRTAARRCGPQCWRSRAGLLGCCSCTRSQGPAGEQSRRGPVSRLGHAHSAGAPRMPEVRGTQPHPARTCSPAGQPSSGGSVAWRAMSARISCSGFWPVHASWPAAISCRSTPNAYASDAGLTSSPEQMSSGATTATCCCVSESLATSTRWHWKWVAVHTCAGRQVDAGWAARTRQHYGCTAQLPRRTASAPAATALGARGAPWQ